MPCVYTSGWQFLFWYQRPDQIDEKNPALDFWREIPTVFDETRFLKGEIGKFASSRAVSATSGSSADSTPTRSARSTFLSTLSVRDRSKCVFSVTPIPMTRALAHQWQRKR